MDHTTLTIEFTDHGTVTVVKKLNGLIITKIECSLTEATTDNRLATWLAGDANDELGRRLHALLSPRVEEEEIEGDEGDYAFPYLAADRGEG